MHSSITAGTNSWIGAGAGRSGLAYNYGITNKNGQIELYIDRGDYEENKKIFDELFKNKELVEGDFGGRLEWQRLEDKRASRIRKIYSYSNLSYEQNWDRLQQEMIDDMIRLEKALKKFVNKI